MNISIHYYAVLRDQRGLQAEAIETNASTPNALYQELAAKHGFRLERQSLKVAINDEFAAWDATLKNGDTVVFIPPVAGG